MLLLGSGKQSVNNHHVIVLDFVSWEGSNSRIISHEDPKKKFSHEDPKIWTTILGGPNIHTYFLRNYCGVMFAKRSNLIKLELMNNNLPSSS